MLDRTFILPFAPPRMTAQMKGERVDYDESGRPFIRHFRRPELVRIEARYETALRAFAPAVPLSGPVGVSFGYFFPASNDGRADLRRRGVAMRRKVTTPDVDNIGKNLLDCMTRAGFFADDCSVALIHAEKFEVLAFPRIWIRVRELSQYPAGLL